VALGAVGLGELLLEGVEVLGEVLELPLLMLEPVPLLVPVPAAPAAPVGPAGPAAPFW